MIRDDFVGFEFDGIHSSDLNIIRTSDGDRFNLQLTPDFNDTTTEIPGNDGSYYWRTDYKQRTFNIPIAFDSVTEKEYAKIVSHFSGGKSGKLIFDETPYKYYNVLIQSPPQFTTVPFAVDGKRVYKGEGTITFIAYDPFGYGRYKTLNEVPATYDTINEWAEGSRLPQNGDWGKPLYSADETRYVPLPNNYYQANDNLIIIYPVWNGGGKPADWLCRINRYYLHYQTNGEKPYIACYQGQHDGPRHNIIWKIGFGDGLIPFHTNDTPYSITNTGAQCNHYNIDSSSNLVIGDASLTFEQYNDVGIVNKIITEGDFNKIPAFSYKVQQEYSYNSQYYIVINLGQAHDLISTETCKRVCSFDYTSKYL